MSSAAELHERVARLPTRLLELLVRWTHVDGELDRRMEMILPRSRSAPPQLSFAQERLWFLDQLQPGNTAYNLPLVLPFRDPVDAPLLRRALDLLVVRHESLRTTFAVIGGLPVQCVAAESSIELQELDIRGRFDAHEHAQRVLREQVMRPFDLQRGPLVRALLVHRAPDESLLLVTMHHIISDGWSCGVFTHELLALYGTLLQERPPSLPELPIQYADFAVWQRDWLHGETLADQVAYWKEQLAGAPILLDLPTDPPRPMVESPQGAFQTLVVPTRIGEPLRELARARDATLYMVMLAGFAALLSRYSGMKDVVIGSPIANRSRHELEGLIGFFVNMLAMRIDLRDVSTVGALIDRVRDVALGAYEHQDLPFEKLVEEFRPRRSLGRSPVHQVAFVLQNTPGADTGISPVEPPTLGWRDDPQVALGSAKFDLTLSFAEQGAGLVGTCEYRTELFDHRTIARFLRRYLHVLEAMTGHPEAPVASLPVRLPDEPDVPYQSVVRGAIASSHLAVELLGLTPESRIAVVDDCELAQLAAAACDAVGATIQRVDHGSLRTSAATHVLGSTAALASIGSEALPPEAIVCVVGWPCFDVIWTKWGARRVIGLWGIPGAPCCARLTLNAPEATLDEPVEGCLLEVLDPMLRRQVVDLWGDLHVGGSIVPPPLAPSSEWISNPFVPGGQLYRTGLRARRRDDGRIEIGGLIERGIRVEGMWVDPGRLQALFCQHPAVEAASVVAQGDGDDAYLVAFVVPRGERRLGEEDLTRYAAERLPAGLVPRRIIIADELPAPGAVAPQAGRAVESPHTPAEAVIARVWTEVLKRPVTDVHSNFFDLGGNSLTSVQVIARIRDILGVDVPLHRLFDAPTVAELARNIESNPSFVGVEPARADAREVEPALRRTFSMLDIDAEGLTQEAILDLVHTLEDWEVDELLEQLLPYQA